MKSFLPLILLLLLIQEEFLSVNKRKYVHEVQVLVNRLVKLAQEKVWLGEHLLSLTIAIE